MDESTRVIFFVLRFPANIYTFIMNKVIIESQAIT